MSNIRYLISVSILGLFGMVVVWFVLVSQFLRTLKRRHVTVWHDLGEPALLANNTPQTNLAIFYYLKRRAYQQLGDQELWKLGDRLRIFITIYIIAFLFVISLMAVALFVGGVRDAVNYC